MPRSLRPRTSKVKPDTYASGVRNSSSSQYINTNTSPLLTQPDDSVLPVYTIDLSLPPARRYVAAATDYRHVLQDLKTIFDDIVESMKLPKCIMHFIARLLLRRVCCKEQTEEIRGISKASGVPLYLLIAYNIFLDLFMGCTSGGVPVQLPGTRKASMMHFRTLDWGMPELRRVLVQYDFVMEPGGEVVARTISYVGFVGVLTGLRKGLSASINFRPYHNDDSSKMANLKYYMQQVAVTLGFKPSIASIMRDFIVPKSQPLLDHADITTMLPTTLSTAAYMIFCTCEYASVVEKDRITGKTWKTSQFLVKTNHDMAYDRTQDEDQASHIAHVKKSHFGIGMHELVEESIDRRNLLVDRWKTWSKAHGSSGPGKEQVRNPKDVKKDIQGVPLERLKLWMLEYPICNEETHFVCIMDPFKGVFRWVKRFDEG